MPRVELVQKHNMSARRLFIRANNGKVKLACETPYHYRVVVLYIVLTVIGSSQFKHTRSKEMDV